VTGAVQAAAIRRRIRIPLRFAGDYSTTATVVSFTGLTDAQQHVALELGRPNRAFWSIAIEAQLYVLLPLPLLLVRIPRAGRDPAARDRVLRPSVRRCVRVPLPAAPRVDCAATGDVGPAVAAAANRAGRRRRALAGR